MGNRLERAKRVVSLVAEREWLVVVLTLAWVAVLSGLSYLVLTLLGYG